MSSNNPITPKIIAVVGATGHQGSSVVQAFLALRPRWHVRALTRDPTSAAAQRLSAQGAEVVQADLDEDEDAGGALSSSSSSLEAALAGAHAIFLNTDFWAPYRAALAAGETHDAASRRGFATEMRHARNAVAAAAKAASATLERLVYSALAPLREASGGRYTHSYHWDSKAAAAAWIASPASGLADRASYIYVGAYSTNPLIMPQKMQKKKKNQQETADADADEDEDEECEYILRLPAGRKMRMPVLDIAASTGPFVRCLAEDEPANTNLLAYDEYLDVDGLMQAWTEAVGDSPPYEQQQQSPPLQPRFVQMGIHEMSRATGLPLEVLEAPPFVEEFGYMGGVSGGSGGDFVEPHQLTHRPDTRAFADTLKSHGREYLLGAKLTTAATI